MVSMFWIASSQNCQVNYLFTEKKISLKMNKLMVHHTTLSNMGKLIIGSWMRKTKSLFCTSWIFLNIYFATDHFSLDCRFAIRTIYKRTNEAFQTKQYLKADPATWNSYNDDKVRFLLARSRCDLDMFTKAAVDAANMSLNRERNKKKQKQIIRPQV